MLLTMQIQVSGNEGAFAHPSTHLESGMYACGFSLVRVKFLFMGKLMWKVKVDMPPSRCWGVRPQFTKSKPLVLKEKIINNNNNRVQD